ncbi:prepilin-type N-terminal cleavage/methylation domain-containing protein [Francisella sp. Scap27]|uniref:prepilin-type N-terminal cleavage/methylation domain-containing protein n=1 Tax=Francisella sp. Scap27 TaxID=2589986 RepID=UPI0015C0C308|nr:prepilin-type N-terminal cleavage/methylation domain-containing protein [Francisella sp. Scap27]
MKFLKNNKGFSLVELMVVIAIVAILAAISVPAYSNYIMRVRFQDEISKMDNYRKAITDFIQNSGVTTDAEFQSGIANVKDNYLGDDNVAIMSELKANNGTLLSHPVINGSTYQIALTPRINDNGSLINWECNIRNETSNSAPPSGAMPNGCNSTDTDLNDDQSAYNEEYTSLEGIRDTAIAAAHQAWNDLTTDYVDASTDDTTTEGSLGSLNVLKNAALTNQQNNTDLINDARGVMDDYFNPYDTSNLEANYSSSLSTLNDNGDVLTSESTPTEFANAGLTELTAYRDSIEDTDSAEYTAANTAVTNRTTEISNLETAKSNYDTGVAAAPDLSSEITSINSQISDKNTELSQQALTDSNFTDKTNTASQEFSDSLGELNSSDAFSGDHVDRNNS